MFLMNKKILFSAGTVFIILFAFILIITFSSKEVAVEEENTHIIKMNPVGFTFFDLGANSLLTEKVKENLAEKLGAGTLAEWGTLDLSMNYKGFLQQYFNELYKLNLKLNDAAGARVEHNILDITYRYPPKAKSPFNYVRLSFSNHTKKPLLFRIKSEKEGGSITDALKSKYGEPKVIEWENGKGVSLHWHKDEDILIFTQSTDRIGNPEFHIRINFVENIKEMISTEEKEAINREEDLKQEGRAAF